jgi:hypothetical protein
MGDFPTGVKDAWAILGDLFTNAPARRHVAEDLTGLLLAAQQTVRGINRAVAVTTDQACLNRWLPEGAWDVTALHDRHLAWWQGDPSPRDRARGVMAIEQTRGDQAGKLIEDVGWCGDPANARSVSAHDDLISHDVCPSGAPSPMEGRRFRKTDAGPKGACKAHTELCRERRAEAITRGIPGDFTCDSYGTSAKGLHHLQGTQRAYVGDVKRHRKVGYDGRAQALQAVARPMPGQAQQPVRVGNRRYWYFRKQRRLPDVNHPVRIVWFWQERDEAEAHTALGSKRLGWEVIRLGLV